MAKLKRSAAELVAAARERVDEIETADLIARVDDPDTVIVDVRDVRERPYHKPVFAQEGKRYVFHCASGWRSALTVATLQDMGFEASHLKDGFSTWEARGGPVERAEPEG